MANYLIITQKKLPVPGDIVEHINLYTGNETILKYSSFPEAQRAVGRIISFLYDNNYYDIYVAIITYDNCNCCRKIVDVLFLKKVIEENINCTTLISPEDINDITWNLQGGESDNITITNYIPNEDWTSIIITRQPEYGELSQSGFQLFYTAINTNLQLSDIIEYKIVSVITGCSKTGKIMIRINSNIIPNPNS